MGPTVHPQRTVSLKCSIQMGKLADMVPSKYPLISCIMDKGKKYGLLYAFGVSPGARHMCSADKIKIGHTMFEKAKSLSAEELQERDHELLGTAAIAWALMVSKLPTDIITEFTRALEDSKVPALFSPTINGDGV